VPLVTVFWNAPHIDDAQHWDTHKDSFNRLKNHLLPHFDRGLAALLDDVATIAKMAAASVDDVSAAAAKASAKAVGVVVDDTAVTPRYVHGFLANRELPIIRRIAVGSLRNKLVFILPVALLLSQFLPWLMTPILMCGGAYLVYEGAEKVWEALGGGHHGPAGVDEAAGPEVGTPEHEQRMVSGAIRTDLILSAEIMAIALAEVAARPLLVRALSLVIVAVVITALVYGVVAIIVKMDDVGLLLAERPSAHAQRTGMALVRAMPVVMRVLETVGVAAMLWVGGHILFAGTDTLGWHGPYGAMHHLEEAIHHVPVVGGVLAWFADTLASALVGLAVGAAVIVVVTMLRRLRRPRKDVP